MYSRFWMSRTKPRAPERLTASKSPMSPATPSDLASADTVSVATAVGPRWSMVAMGLAVIGAQAGESVRAFLVLRGWGRREKNLLMVMATPTAPREAKGCLVVLDAPRTDLFGDDPAGG
jgi:hypothetical protein